MIALRLAPLLVLLAPFPGGAPQDSPVRRLELADPSTFRSPQLERFVRDDQLRRRGDRIVLPLGEFAARAEDVQVKVLSGFPTRDAPRVRRPDGQGGLRVEIPPGVPCVLRVPETSTKTNVLGKDGIFLPDRLVFSPMPDPAEVEPPSLRVWKLHLALEESPVPWTGDEYVTRLKVTLIEEVDEAAPTTGIPRPLDLSPPFTVGLGGHGAKPASPEVALRQAGVDGTESVLLTSDWLPFLTPTVTAQSDLGTAECDVPLAFHWPWAFLAICFIAGAVGGAVRVYHEGARARKEKRSPLTVSAVVLRCAVGAISGCVVVVLAFAGVAMVNLPPSALANEAIAAAVALVAGFAGTIVFVTAAEKLGLEKEPPAEAPADG